MVDRLERLVNLVIALRETRRPLTVERINQRVAGYGGDRGEAWRRMFERDKADLRALGVPLRTARLDRFDDTTGYRIDPADYDLPQVSLSPGELTALALAVQLTGLVDDATPALDKLAVDANLPGEQRIKQRLPLELSLDAPNRSVLSDALSARQQVRFDYRSAMESEASPRRRSVAPQALVHWRGRWYLRGRDLEKDADRTFRLDRIVGAVRLHGDPGAVVLPDDPPDPAEVVPSASREPIDAVVEADDDTAWVVARRASGAGRDTERDGWRRFTVRTWDTEELIGWLAELGSGAELIGPTDIRQKMIEHLEGMLAPDDQATASPGAATQ